MARRSLLAGVVALALLCSACAVDATVTVKVEPDGSGVVRVDVTADAEAVQTAEVGGGTLEDRVRLADLPAAGWTVEPWVRNPDGSASLRLSKPFSSVDEVPGILRELNGDAGPLQDSAFTREHSFLSTSYSAKATVDLGKMGTGITSDADLVAKLQAQGVDVSAIDAQLGAQLRDALHVRLVVELPGGSRTVVEPASGEAATLDTSVSVRDATRMALLVIGGLLVLAAIVVALWPHRRGPRAPGRPHLAEAPHSRYLDHEEPGAPEVHRHHRFRHLHRDGSTLSWDDATAPTTKETPPES